MNNDLSKKEKEKRIWIWIKQQLSLLDSSFSKLANLHGTRKQNFAIVRHSPYPKYENIIAKKLGLQPWDLWPERYDANHNPNRISSRYPAHKCLQNNTLNQIKHNKKL